MLAMADTSNTRLIAGALYARDTKPYAHDLRVHLMAHGHTEATLSPRYGWTEVDMTDLAYSDMRRTQAGFTWVDGQWVVAAPDVPRSPPTPAQMLDRLAENKVRAGRRAQTKVRRLCKDKGLSVMLTLTYRENMGDRGRMARDFDVFSKRMRRLIPGWEYVCVFEQQKRGAWHAHIAVPKVLSHYAHQGRLVRSYDLLRSMWRGVVGVDNGNVDVSRNRKVARSQSRLASYISKYISKGFALSDRGGRDSYSYGGKGLAAPVLLRCKSGVLSECITDCVGLLDAEWYAARSRWAKIQNHSGCYYLSLSP